MEKNCSNTFLLALIVAVLICAAIGRTVGGPDPLVMIAIMLSSLTSSIAGFAFSAICGAVLFRLWEDPVAVVQVMVACSIANQTTMVWSMRHAVHWQRLMSFVIGGVVGLPLGVWVLLHADKERYTEMLGTFLCGYSAYTLLGKPRTLAWEHPLGNAAIGFLGGITGGAAAMPSAPLTVWCRLRGWDKNEQRALFQPFILFMQVPSLLLISLIRHSSGGPGFDYVNLLCVPAGLLGTMLGMACFRHMSNVQFAFAVNVLLIVSGLSFIL